MARIIVTLMDGEKLVLVKTQDFAAAKRVQRDVLRWISDRNIILIPAHTKNGVTIREVPGEWILSVEIEEPRDP